ncbi:kinesin-like protein KIF6 [Hylaeus anthracinus]|uniref:kinesin-like protein KIF6 n=1 Tax=Hylaeus anthracinus TaxID=313031 RepID=UPI0023B90347|nr:kinesin-like protein KIF6 [Hylaeus anthracinus]
MVKNAIKVYARLLPEKNRKNAVEYQVYHRPKKNVEEDVLFLASPTQKSKDYPDNRAESWNFSFFRIFEESTTQEDVFDNVARPVVESALDGYNGTIFAYGQTASGKTYSIIGNQRNHADRGIIPRSMRYLFDVIQKRPENVYTVEVAFMEIYNENGYDLLDRRQREFAVTRLEDLPRVTMQEDENGKLHLKNLTFHSVASLEDAYELLLIGDHYRITTETPMNPQSSRSHCIFTIVVSKKEFGAEQYTRAKVHLVDLAGSERVYKCSISGVTLNEAKHINLSLHYLEQVIVCLGQDSAGHIPYRNSCLTSILRDSLGGNCMTTMLATVSVGSSNIDETVSTCKFAQRVALIRNDVKLILETSMQSENALLKLENERLKQQIEAMTVQTSSQELTADDKRKLDRQIRNFLESNVTISWDYNPKKTEYCFESFRRIFELSRDPNSCLKKLEHYKDMVVQRDKEISLLIDLLKKKKGEQHRKEDHCNRFNNVFFRYCCLLNYCSINFLAKPTRDNPCLKPVKEPRSENEDFDEIKLNIQSNASGEPCNIKCQMPQLSIETTRTMLDASLPKSITRIDETIVDNILPTVFNTEKEISVLNRVPLKKLRRKPKHSKNVDQVDQCQRKADQNRANCEESENTSHVSVVSFDRFSTNRSTMPELLPCNIINLTLNDPAENKMIEDINDKSQEISQQHLRRTDKKQLKCDDPQLYAKKNVSAREKIRTNVKIDTDSNDPNVQSDSSATFYQRLLHFNVPDTRAKSSSKELFRNESTSMINESREQKFKADSDVRNLKILEKGHDYMEGDSREISNVHLAKGNDYQFNDDLESNRNKRTGRRTSFTNDYPDQSCISSRGLEIGNKDSDEKVGYDKSNEDFENALPLTGDPEIDEEIIAFYTAKRSGGTY